jgi:heme A synthase
MGRNSELLSNPDRDSFFAFAAIVFFAVGAFCDPNKSRLRKWLYWGVAPVCIAVFLGLAFHSFAAGAALWPFILLVFGFSYLRYWI